MPHFLWTNFSSAVRSLREQWQRAALSACGIMVGATAIIVLVSIATGVKADVSEQVDQIGANILIVIPGRIDEGTFNPNLAGESHFREEDVQRLQKTAGVIRVVPWTFAGGGARRGNEIASSMLVGTRPDWFRMHPTVLESGRVMDERDETQAVCVIGSSAKDELFGKSAALGQTIKINGRPYKVIGVTKDRKSSQSMFSFGGLQNMVYIPYLYLKKIEKDVQIHRIMIQTAADAEPKALMQRLNDTLGQRLDRQQFQVLTQEDLLGLIFKLMGILTWLLTGLTSIALFVGGVGIMSVMLMSVNERSKEIGIRKTVGARQRDVFTQFLIEALLLAMVGGLAGLALSYAACLGLYYLTPVKPMITAPIVLLAIGVCISVGVVFGLIPAMHAARKDPVAALRSE